MKAEFHTSDLLSKEQLNNLSIQSDHSALARFALMFLAFIRINILVVLSWKSTWIFLILAQFGYAILCCSLFAALHETGHGTAFKSKKLNRIGAFLAGLAHIYPPSLFRALHYT